MASKGWEIAQRCCLFNAGAKDGLGKLQDAVTNHGEWLQENLDSSDIKSQAFLVKIRTVEGAINELEGEL